MRVARCVVVAALVVSATRGAAEAQIGYSWSFEDLFAQSDLVVLGEHLDTDDTGIKTFNNELKPPLPVVEVTTRLRVLVVFKGDFSDGPLALRHYWHDYENLPNGVVNGGSQVYFGQSHGLYLLFLKRTPDEAFVPVSGQVFPDDAVYMLQKVSGLPPNNRIERTRPAPATEPRR